MTPLDVQIVGNASSPDWWSIGITAGAAILGAVIGAAISLWVAKLAARENRLALQEVQRNDEIAATLRAMTKLMEIVNAAAGYHFQIEREISAAKLQHPGREFETWQIMVARVGKPHDVHIGADDLVAFIKSRNFDFVTDLLHLVSLYNSMIFGFEAYSERREELNSLLAPDELNGAMGSKFLTYDELMKVQPYLIGVKNVADHLRKEAKEVYDGAVALVDRFGPIVKTYFNDPKFPIPAIIKNEKD
jgi:hypothetical protein